MKKLIGILIIIIAGFGTFAQSSGELSITFTTKTYNGQYKPKHLLAVWVENSNGTFVKTLAAYTGSKYRQYLSNWKSATSTYDRTDAITGATLSSHGTLTCSWDGTDVNSILQDDGTYTIYMEFTESNATGKVTSFTFDKSSASVALTPASSSSYFSNISATWIPVATAVEDTKMTSACTIYPNPASSYINIKGEEVNSVIIYNILGKIVLKAEGNHVDISSLAKGKYIVKILTGNETYCNNLIKM